jgi:tetratricopeptide (TPR) repeat protein
MEARRLAIVSMVVVGCAARGAPAPSSTELTAAERRVAPPPPTVAALARGAVVLEGLGDLHMPVTASRDAQPWFDQGLRLTYAFNHDEAARSFARASEIDPSCAMCFWGAALVLGPNYNVPMLPDRAQTAWDALVRARALAPRTTPVERALVGALALRYPGPAPLDPPRMQPYDVAYADAMRDVARRFPDHVDVQVLFAEAMMDVNPWKLWTRDGEPAPGTEEIVATLERVLARAPMHPGANHYYIHAIEASRHPERAVPSAERLGALMPGAGHVVHMPAHIFQRVGRYADASAANERAIAADLAYMGRVEPPGYYPMYLGHNYGFLAFSASMEGRRAKTLSAARASAQAIPPEMIDMMPGMDFMVSEPLLAMVRFGAWDELLVEPRPDPKYPVLTAFWHHGHGMALAAKGRLDDARRDLAELATIRDRLPPDMKASNNAARDIVGVAGAVLEARIATLAKDPKGLSLWAAAVARADELHYAEPDDWFYPVRHYYGAALLDAGRARDAETVYREDLRVHPRNGWALFGVWRALTAQGKTAEAVDAKRAFDEAWKQADVVLTTSAP